MRLLALCSVLLCLAAGSASAAVTVTITLTNTRATVSRPTVPTGATTVTVVNKGTHGRSVTLAGAHTALVAPGHRATLKVQLTRLGTYVFTASGTPMLSGKLTTIAVVAAGTVTTPSGSASMGSSCPKPVSTTVSVALDDGVFTFSQSPVPCGQVTFALTNVGKVSHSLYLESAGVQSGGLAPGQSEKLTVSLSPGSITWVDGVYESDLGGAEGTLPVSG